jgi:DNA-binding transcriptional ArsR family regulator
MSLSSLPSPDDHDALLQRFVAASRRGEIVALINSARSESELAAVVAAELCEAYDAEIGFVLLIRADSATPELIGRVGLSGDIAAAIFEQPVCSRALSGTVALTERGTDLLELGIRNVAVAPGTAGGSRLLVGVGRLYEQDFEELELALLESVTKSTAHALERFGLERQLQQQWLTPAETPSPLSDIESLAEFFRRLGHPLRLRILLALGGDTLSPSELDERLGVGLGLVAYHVRTLRDDGLMALVETRAARGSLESFYRLTARGELARDVLAATDREIRDIAERT